MFSGVFAALAVGQLVAGWSGGTWWLRRRSRMLVLPTLLCLVLGYENGVIALGAWVGPGPLLEALSVPRFAVHAVLTPLLVPWSLAAARRAELDWAYRRSARVTAWGLAGGLIAYSLTDLVGLHLTPERWADTLRYVPLSGSAGAALPAIITGLVVLIVGVRLWLRHHYAGLLVPSLVMALIAGFSATAPPLANAGELVLDIGLLSTSRWLDQALLSRQAVPTRLVSVINRRLGWATFPLVVAGGVLAYLPLPALFGPPGPGLPVSPTQYDVALTAQTTYLVLMVVHAQLSHAVFGFPPKGRGLRRFHVGFGYANLPLLVFGQLLFFFPRTAALASMLTQLLLVSITVHVVLGAVFASRRRRPERLGPTHTLRHSAGAR